MNDKTSVFEGLICSASNYTSECTSCFSIPAPFSGGGSKRLK